jgi:hypothetical protein
MLTVLMRIVFKLKKETKGNSYIRVNWLAMERDPEMTGLYIANPCFGPRYGQSENASDWLCEVA